MHRDQPDDRAWHARHRPRPLTDRPRGEMEPPIPPCTNAKPNPFVGLNHFTLPLVMFAFLRIGVARTCDTSARYRASRPTGS
jgi:hypothetical protein